VAGEVKNIWAAIRTVQAINLYWAGQGRSMASATVIASQEMSLVIRQFKNNSSVVLEDDVFFF